jgi:predicted ATPase/DNA-binding CsgD family transcriptional regulator
LSCDWPGFKVLPKRPVRRTVDPAVSKSWSGGVAVRAMMNRRLDNLPADLTNLVGRRAESTAVKERLAGSRLVTLAGIGGVGKTRLALTVSRQLRRAFNDGVWLVQLAELSKPELLALTVMQALGIRPQGDESVARMIDYLADKQLLVVLDNCEHLVDECAHLVDAVLQACPRVRVLTTSREPLRIDGEVVFRVPPLSLPATDGPLSSGDIAQYDAITLFVERASAVAPNFAMAAGDEQAVAALCRRLDGLPLAIELAAVRMSALSAEQLLAHHDMRYELLTRGSRAVARRHQTLRAAVDWSYELCSEQEQLLWARLSVFISGIDLVAAEYVCSDEALSGRNLVEALTGLVDRSILTLDDGRYSMLETLREYGRERLAQWGGERVFRRRHQDYYLYLAEQVEGEWFGPDQAALFGRVQHHHANLRAALESCLVEPDQTRAGFRLAAALWAFWIGCGLQREGRHWLDRLLAADAEPSAERAAALWVNGYLAVVEGAIPQGLAMLDECCDLARRLGDQPALAHATYIRGLGETFRDNLDTGIAYLEAGVRLERAAPGFNPHLTVALVNLGVAACYGEYLNRAVEVLEECRATCASRGEHWMMSWTLLFLGLADWTRGRVPEAEECVREALIRKRTLGDVLGAAVAVEIMAWCAVSTRDAERAARLFGASQMLWEPHGAFLFRFERLRNWSAQYTLRAKEVLGVRAFEAAEHSGRQFTPEQAIAYALGEQRATQAADEPSDAPAILTRREAEIATLVAEGMTNKEIANRLVIATRTVEGHVEHILAKLGLTSRTQVAALFAGKR